MSDDTQHDISVKHRRSDNYRKIPANNAQARFESGLFFIEFLLDETLGVNRTYYTYTSEGNLASTDFEPQSDDYLREKQVGVTVPKEESLNVASAIIAGLLSDISGEPRDSVEINEVKSMIRENFDIDEV